VAVSIVWKNWITRGNFAGGRSFAQQAGAGARFFRVVRERFAGGVMVLRHEGAVSKSSSARSSLYFSAERSDKPSVEGGSNIPFLTTPGQTGGHADVVWTPLFKCLKLQSASSWHKNKQGRDTLACFIHVLYAPTRLPPCCSSRAFSREGS